MARRLDEVIAELPSAQRREIELQVAGLMEEMALRDLEHELAQATIAEAPAIPEDGVRGTKR